MENQKDNTEGTRKGRRRDYTQEVRKKRKLSEETKKKISEALKGRHVSPETEFKKGHHSYPRTKEWRKKVGKKVKEAWEDPAQQEKWERRNRKISKAQKGKKKEGSYHKNSGSFKKGHEPWNKGTRDPDYKGVNTKIRERILERDNHKCQLCGVTENETKRLDIHHIDWNHHNNKDNNLVTLCMSCHSKQQANKEKWITYWENKLRT